MSGTYNVRVWTIIGDANVGKSTIIGNLISQEGRGRGGIRRVFLRGGGFLTILAHRMARQEGEVTPQKAVDDVNRAANRLQSFPPPISTSWINVLIALRSNAVPHASLQLPAAHEYLSRFVQEGWQIESIVVISPEALPRLQDDHYHRYGAPIYWLNSPRVSEREWRRRKQLFVGQVRNHFGWA